MFLFLFIEEKDSNVGFFFNSSIYSGEETEKVQIKTQCSIFYLRKKERTRE